jgi:hypothetical protein
MGLFRPVAGQLCFALPCFMKSNCLELSARTEHTWWKMHTATLTGKESLQKGIHAKQEEQL